MRRERFNDERVQSSGGLLNSDGLSSLPFNPSSSLFPTLVETQETGLSSSFDQLIWLSDEFVSEDPFGETLSGLDGR